MCTPTRWLPLITAITLPVFTALSAHAAPQQPPSDAPDRVLIPNMQATGQFFTGSLTIDVRFGQMQRPRKDIQPATPDGKPAQPADAPPEGKSGKGGGKRKGGGGGKGGPPLGGGGPGGPRGGGNPDDRTPTIREERNPATQFHITLTNSSAAPLTIEFLDFDSALGNFAVKPDKIKIAPGETAQTEPMISRLGIPTEDLPLKIRVRNGATSEEQKLILKIIPPPASPALPPAPTS